MIRIRVFILLLNLMVFLPIEGQEIIRSVIGIAGTTRYNEGFLLRQTIGQPPGAEVFSDDLLILRQGFQQAIDHPSVLSSPLVPGDHIHPGAGFGMYPNPARDHVDILLEDAVNSFDISIVSIYGKRVYYRQDFMVSHVTLNLQFLPAGIYFVTVISDGQRSTRKLILL